MAHGAKNNKIVFAKTGTGNPLTNATFSTVDAEKAPGAVRWSHFGGHLNCVPCYAKFADGHSVSKPWEMQCLDRCRFGVDKDYAKYADRLNSAQHRYAKCIHRLNVLNKGIGHAAGRSKLEHPLMT